MKTRQLWTLVLALVSALGATPNIVRASIIQYDIAGSITVFGDPNGLVAGLIEPQVSL